jgi:RHS repeat-associated protein
MTTAVPDPNGTYGSNVAFTSTNVYDFNTGKVKSSTDPNGKTTSYDYSDSLNRLKLVTKSDTARVRYNYSDTPGDLYVQVLTDQDASRSIESRKYFDGLGRPIRGFLYDATASTPWIVTDTYYDILGRVSKASNPYRVSTPSSAVPATCSACTTTGYDVLGRVISVMTPDNALVTTAYGASLSTILGTTVTVTDQAGKLRRSLTNALGRLVRVDEPDTNGILGDVSSPNQPTSYFYDAMGNLRTVTQGSQQRFFAYDSLSRLLRARNPELTVNVNLPALTDPVTSNSQWSIAYTYDNNGNLLTKTDPRGVVSTYVYDVLNRNTNITYSNDPAGTPAVSRFYDGFRAGQNNNVLNSKGQLWQTETAGASGSRTITDNFDSLGRPLSQGQQFFSNNAWSSSYTVQRTYDLAGHVASETYPSNRFVNYNFDAAGRLGDKDAQNLAFKGNLGGEARTYASEVLYSPFGGMAKERLGTDTALYNKQFYNVRGQLAEIRVGTYSTDETWWNRGAILNVYSGLASWTESREDNNGNLRKQMLFIPNNDQITGYVDSTFFYDYDSLNRLDVAREVLGGQNNWVQDYDYDRYGNRTINQNNTSGPTTGPPINKKDFTVNTANNQLGVPVNQSGTMTYDYAGNLTTDTYSGVTAAVLRAYDAENRMTKETQANSYVAGEYTYNANGQRVRRKVNGGETWQVYGFDGELLAEYAANASYLTPQKEYGYRNGQLLITAAAGSAGWGAPPSFTPPATLVTGLDIKLEHLTELRTAVNDLRAHAGLSPYSFTVDPNPERYVTSIKADHIRQLRTALEQARSQLGLSTSYAHPTLTENSSWIYATDFQELRDQILTAWNSGTGGVEINWLVADQLGTPRLIFDKTGSLANTKRHDYLPFGEELVAGQGARTTALGYAADTVRQKFTSKERDTETGLDYFGARHYASTQGRFVITDPLTASGKPVEPQSWNRYQYCLNNPLMYTDPTGLIWGIYSQNGHRYAEWFVDKEAMLNSGHDDITEATTFVFDQGNGTEIRLNPNGPQGGAGFVVASSGGPFPSLAGFFWNASNYDYISKGWQVYSTGKGASGRWTGAVADDPVGNAAIGACFGGLGSLMRPGSGALNGTAAAAVEDYAASLRSSGQPLPTISSAAVDSSGSTFFGVSGKPFPELIHPELAARVPATSLEPWHPANCAEFKAVNNALLGGSKLNSLEIHTIRTANGEIMPRCANCRITTAGAKVTSDP